MHTVQILLQQTGLPRLEARMLLEFALQKPRSWLLAHDTDSLPQEIVDRFQSLVAQRLAGQPMAYLVGYREFRGHPLQVSPAVLIPRPDTELLVDVGLMAIEACQAGSLLDLGTGSGAIAIAIALACPQLAVTATDVSAEALQVARTNAQMLGAAVRWFEGDWYEALPLEGRFDVILSNPPYIAVDDRHLLEGDLRFEPPGALTDGFDGLTHLTKIVKGSVRYLAVGGQLWVEHGFDQSAAVQAVFKQVGFKNVVTHRDLAGQPRVTGGAL